MTQLINVIPCFIEKIKHGIPNVLPTAAAIFLESIATDDRSVHIIMFPHYGKKFIEIIYGKKITKPVLRINIFGRTGENLMRKLSSVYGITNSS